METVFEVLESGRVISFGFSKCLAMAYASRDLSAQLWQVDRESEAEAAVRRMKALDNFRASNLQRSSLEFGDSYSMAADRLLPPPTPKETQLDWNTGEPIEAERSWLESSGVWIACVSDSRPERLFCSCIVSGKMAAGSTREAAVANLRAIRASLKSQTK